MNRPEVLVSPAELDTLDYQCARASVQFDEIIGAVPTPLNLLEPDERTIAYHEVVDEAENQMVFWADARASAELSEPDVIDTIRWVAVAHKMVKQHVGRNYHSRAYFMRSPDDYFKRVVEANLGDIAPFGAAMYRDYRYAQAAASGAVALRNAISLA